MSVPRQNASSRPDLLQHVLDERRDLRAPLLFVDVGVFARLDLRAQFVDVPAIVEQQIQSIGQFRL